MTYANIVVPRDGEKITVVNDRINVADNPILAIIEGDGIGPDITRAAMRPLGSI